jgi:hypothetical protein
LAFGIVIEELAIIFVPYLLAPGSVAARFSRKRESEADYIDLSMMARADHEIWKTVSFCERMKHKREHQLAKKDERRRPKDTRILALLASHLHVISPSLRPFCFLA